MGIGALMLAAGPLAAQTVSLNASTSVLSSSPCSSARAVHDMRCANYAGFKPRLGGDADAAAERSTEPTETRLGANGNGGGLTVPSPDRPALGLRSGRDLQQGMASWYGPGFHGRLTANGERFDMNELTAAHKTLPFGTRVLVHNPRTGKEVVVRINDRGPYAKNRVIDLSQAAAKLLGITARGHDSVVLRELVPNQRGEQLAEGAAEVVGN